MHIDLPHVDYNNYSKNLRSYGKNNDGNDLIYYSTSSFMSSLTLHLTQQASTGIQSSLLVEEEHKA